MDGEPRGIPSKEGEVKKPAYYLVSNIPKLSELYRKHLAATPDSSAPLFTDPISEFLWKAESAYERKNNASASAAADKISLGILSRLFINKNKRDLYENNEDGLIPLCAKLLTLSPVADMVAKTDNSLRKVEYTAPDERGNRVKLTIGDQWVSRVHYPDRTELVTAYAGGDPSAAKEIEEGFARPYGPYVSSNLAFQFDSLAILLHRMNIWSKDKLVAAEIVMESDTNEPPSASFTLGYPDQQAHIIKNCETLPYLIKKK